MTPHRTTRGTAEDLLRGDDSAEVRERLRAVLTVVDAALFRLEIDEMLQELLQRLRGITRADMATVLLGTRDGAALRVRASVGLEEEVRDGGRIPVGEGIARMVAGLQQPAIIDDVSRVRGASPALRQLRSVMAAPLLVHGEVIGVLHVGSRTERVFDEDDLHLLALVAGRVAMAVDRARLLEEARAELAQRRVAEATLDASEQRFRALALASAQAVWWTDPEGRVTTPLPSWEAMTGQSREQAQGAGWLDAVHPEDRDRSWALWNAAVRSRDIYEVEHRVRTASGEYRWMQGRAVPVLEPDGSIREWVGTHTDIHERRRREEAEHFLALAGGVLASTLDFRTTLSTLAKLVIEHLADGCAIDLLTDGGELNRVVLVTRDPEDAERVRELERRYPTPVEAAAGNVTALRTGTPQLYREITDEMLRTASVNEEHYQMWRGIGMRSVISVPLRARGRTLGVITLVSHSDRYRYDEADVGVAEQLAHRAALAIDNARLHRTAERTADRMARLQRITAALSRALTPDDVAAVVVVEALEALGALAGALGMVAEDDDSLVVVRREGLPPEMEQQWERLPLSVATPMAEAVRTGRSVHVTAEERSSRYPALEGVRRETGSGPMSAVPLIAGGKTLGALAFTFVSTRTLTEQDREFIGSLGQLSAQALERARLYEAERRARQQAETANRAKSAFLGVMSHELRTPLNAVFGYADLLLARVGGALTPQQEKHVERIKSSGRHLLELIEEILHYTRLEAGKEATHLEETEAGQAVLEVAEMVRPSAEQKGLELRVEVGDPELQLHTDPRKLRQILLNLLGNAVKFTDRGLVELRAGVQGQSFQATVRDTGPGIPPDRLEDIFEPFAQIDSSHTRAKGGTGLGLTVSRQLARLLGGEITVESHLGRGSAFTLRLPLRPEGGSGGEGPGGPAPSPDPGEEPR